MHHRARTTAALDLIVGRRCLGCGARSMLTPCPACRAELSALPTAPHAAFADRGAIARIVRVAKDGDWRRAGEVLMRLALERDVVPHSVDAVTWVPADRRRAARRGGHLPERLARACARQRGVPAVRTLSRRGHTQLQRRLGRAARAANARASFSTHPALAQRVAPGSRILLIDDVRTTGATLDACSRLLQGAGLEVVPLAIIGVNRDWELESHRGTGPRGSSRVGVSNMQQRKFARSEDYCLTNAAPHADVIHQHERKGSTELTAPQPP